MSMPAERIRERPNLQELLRGLAAAPSIAIRGISDDSRRLQAGGVFIACQGTTRHGLEFVDAAIEAGVAAIVWDSSTGDASLATGNVPFVPVHGLAGHLGEIANRWYAWPSHDLDVIGVTGTNGKTTVAYLAAQALQILGVPSAYIGTLGFGMDELEVDLGLTTPPCLDLHGKLAGFRDAGADAAAIEVSSHALDQGRLDGMRFSAAIFTNLSRDHIDYHGSMRAYGESKARLFTAFDCATRIISLDSEFGQVLANRLGQNVITTSSRLDRVANGRPYVFVRSASATESGSRIVVHTPWGSGEVHVPMPGEFNVSNALQVLALLLSRGYGFDDAARTIASLKAPPGRLQLVNDREAGDLPRVYVDYAHTPAALEAVLRALRPHANGKIWCVFGCGGDRDSGKRPAMGRVVARLADRAVITNDNPRSEDPGQIIAAVQSGMRRPGVVIEDRAAAIAWTLRQAAAEDTVLIAGKGHEDYQLIGDRRLDFSDTQVAKANLAARRAKGGGADS
jgi:UDP-N-acetylmuramoyl-L-alanyl-D-glutamate--2,6-diaminopimelate ligase